MNEDLRMSKDVRVGEEDLSKIIENHRKYFEGDDAGVFADLSGVNLHRVNLENAFLERINFEETSLCHVNLEGAIIRHSRFDRSNLSNVKLLGADLFDAKIIDAKFFNTNLQGTNLTGAFIANANFTGSNLTGSVFNQTVVFNCNFDDVVCDYIYLDDKKVERHPKERSFEPGEFQEYVEKTLFEESVSTLLKTSFYQSLDRTKQGLPFKIEARIGNIVDRDGFPKNRLLSSFFKALNGAIEKVKTIKEQRSNKLDEQASFVTLSLPRNFSRGITSRAYLLFYTDEIKNEMKKWIDNLIKENPGLSTLMKTLRFEDWYKTVKITIYPEYFEYDKEICYEITPPKKEINVLLRVAKNADLKKSQKEIEIKVVEANTNILINKFNVDVKIRDYLFDHISRLYVNRFISVLSFLGGIVTLGTAFLTQFGDKLGLSIGGSSLLLIGAIITFFSNYNYFKVSKVN
jgi:hypothetical protein